MNIRFKVLTLKIISTLLLLVTYSFFSKTFLISGFKEVEREEVQTNTDVLVETFNSMVNALDSRAADWSAWDEAYEYVQRKNKAFEKANLLPETMKLLNLDYLAYFDSKGRLVGERAFDKNKGSFVSYPKSLERLFSPSSQMFVFKPKETAHKGILKIPEGLISFSLRPVFNSNMRGRSKGYILMVRRITDDVAAKISEITGRPVSFETPESAEKNYGLSLQTRTYQKEISNNTILGMAVLNDFYGIPVAVIKMEISRKILQIGETSYLKTMTFFTAFLLIITVTMMHLLDRLLIRRLLDLDKQVNLLDQNNISELTVRGKDELARLAKSMNLMLGTLRARNNELLNLNEIIKSQNQALVNAAKMSALGEMAGGVAHEINTPLTVIKLRSEMIANDLEQNDPQDVGRLKHSLDIIDKTVDRITKIIQSLRTFSREASEQEKIEYSVSAIVSEALNLCQEKFKMHGIDLKIEMSEDFVLMCRPTEIAQVLINLLNNAFDATENSAEKTVTIRTEKLDNQHVEISVIDSGSGIPQEIQDKIMQPFFTTKDFGKGTGIGLSISKGIAESHGGKLYFDRSSRQTRLALMLPFIKIETKIEIAA